MKRIAILILALMGVTAFADPLKNPALNPVTIHATPSGEPIVLVNDGKPMATIVIANNDSSKAAAQEFIEHVKLATGAELPVVTDNSSPITGNLLLIGASSLTKALNITADGIAYEGFRVQTFSNGLAIVDAKRGPEWGDATSAFGVYDVLERFLGVRWYYPGADGTVVPETKDVVIPQVSYTDQPHYTKRVMSPMQAQGLSNDDCGKLCSRWRLGGTAPVMGCSAFGFLAHYYDQYPEIFELSVDGKRNREFPCMGNPKTLELTIKDLEGLWDRNETMPFETGTGNKQPWTDGRAIHIQPWDANLNCHCPYCMAQIDPGNRWGSYSKLMAQFVANLGTEMHKRWPEKKVYYLPYLNYTVPPMDVVFPTNVYVQVCLMYGPALQKEPSVMAEHEAWINGWYKLTGHPVQLWEYQLWPFLKMPFQYPHVIQALYQKHRTDVEGTGLNGVDFPSGVPGEQYAQFGPTMYVWFHLLWNPDFNVDAAIEEYIDLLYGPANEPMRAIIHQMTDRWENVKWKDGLGITGISLKQMYTETMPPSEMEKFAANLELAKSLAPKGSVYERRVNFFVGAADPFLKEAAHYKDVVCNDLTIQQTASEPVVDGNLDEAAWANAPKQHFVTAADGSKAKAETSVQSLWADKGLYLAFHMDEPNINGIRANIAPDRNSTDVWNDDSIEIFLDTEGKGHQYLQYIANSRAALFDPTVKDVGGKSTAQCGAAKLKDSWTLELFIPFSAVSGSPVQAGTTWLGNFVRNRHAMGDELQRWNTQFSSNNHDQSAFGKLMFVDVK